MSQPNEHLEPLELNPWRVLVIAAHPGDIECGASAAVAKWTNAGAEVIYLVATRGELSMPGVEPEDAALIRSAEQSAAAAAVGVRMVDFLDVGDGTVEPSISLRRAIVRDIRRFRPDVVVVMNHRERDPDGCLNDSDHRAVGTAALDAISASATQWAFRDVGAPHIVDTVLVAGSPVPSHAIDVSGHEPDAVAAFVAHEQHLASIAGHPMADSSWLTSHLKMGGEQLAGATAGLAVEQIKYTQGPHCHSTIVKEFVEPDGPIRVMKLPTKSKLSKTSTRARNAIAPTKRPSRGSKAQQSKGSAAPTPAGAMKLKVQLEQRGRSIGIDIPTNVMERLGAGPRAAVVVEINKASFETTIGTSKGQPFIAINADRRKAAEIAVEDTFFIALSAPPSTASETPQGD